MTFERGRRNAENVSSTLVSGARYPRKGRAELVSPRGKRPRTVFLCIRASSQPSCGQFKKRRLLKESFRGVSLSSERPRNRAGFLKRPTERTPVRRGDHHQHVHSTVCWYVCKGFQNLQIIAIYTIKKKNIKTPLSRDYLTGRPYGAHASEWLSPLPGVSLLLLVSLAG